MRNIDWNEFEDLIDALSKKIISDNFQPDILIAIARGGWVPARYLSDKLSVKKMASIGLTYTDSNRTVIEAYSYPGNLDGKKVLVIEDRLESAKSLKTAKELLFEDAADVRAATLFIRSDSIVKPEYYLSSDDEEIIFPWEK